LCDAGCSLLGVVTDPNFNYEPHIIVYPTQPTARQSRLGALIGTNWRPDTAKVSWVPAVILSWKTNYGSSYAPVDWLNQSIEAATFTVVAPSIEILRGTHEKPLKYIKDYPSVELGTWTVR